MFALMYLLLWWYEKCSEEKKNVIKLKFGIDLHTTQWAKRTLSLVERSKPNMSQGADLVENNFAQGILKILLRGKGYFKCSNVGF